MSSTNAIAPFNNPSLRDLADSLGITQFPSETSWNQTMGGLLIQGGVVTGVASGATVVVPFIPGFITQTLGVFAQPQGTSVLGWSVTAVSKNSFSLVNSAVGPRDFYWWAIGV